MNERGQVLAGILLVVLVISIFVPSYVFFTRQESTSTVTEKRRTNAFHLAEAGTDRGYWKLKERSEYWEQIGEGTPIGGYDNDTVYADIPSSATPSGEYVIRISSHPTNQKWRIITSVARDKSTNELRAIETIVERQSINSAIFGDSTVQIQGSATVHWGSVSSLQNITASADLFPRKFSRQNIVNRDTSGPSPPNTDGIEWWSYYSVPDRAGIDFDKYKSSAQANNISYAPDKYYYSTTIGDPVNVLQNNVNDTRNAYWYFENNVKFTGNVYIYGTIIVRGNFEMMGNAQGSYTTTIPAEAWKEYQKIDAVAANQYPGDTGYRSNAATYTFDNSTTKIKIRGFLYVGGNATFTGNSSLNGAAVIVGNITGTGSCTVYYDDTLDIKVLNASIVRKSWKEIPARWP